MKTKVDYQAEDKARKTRIHEVKQQQKLANLERVKAQIEMQD